MGQMSFVDVLLCPDVQESEVDAQEEEERGEGREDSQEMGYSR